MKISYSEMEKVLKIFFRNIFNALYNVNLNDSYIIFLYFMIELFKRS